MFFDLKPNFENMNVEQGELLYFDFTTKEKVLNSSYFTTYSVVYHKNEKNTLNYYEHTLNLAKKVLV